MKGELEVWLYWKMHRHFLLLRQEMDQDKQPERSNVTDLKEGTFSEYKLHEPRSTLKCQKERMVKSEDVTDSATSPNQG